jgi:hypothetical protein
MQHSKACRGLAMGALAVVGVTATFAVGARAGAALNGQVSAISVARIPLRELQAPPPPPAPTAEPRPAPEPDAPLAHK